MHRLAMPRVLPWRLSALSSVTMMRVPLAPIGWPSAVPPPLILIRSCGMPMSRIANMATQAKASLISHSSTSPASQPAFWSTFSIAPIGATVNLAGSCACAAMATIRAIGCWPFSLARLSRVSTTAAAPSEIELEVAAVIVPSLAKAGRSVGILSGRPLPGCSSCSTICSPLRVVTVTGTTSSAKAPDSIAALARRSDSME